MSEKTISEMNIIYNINKDYITIFGSKFVKNNKNICKMVIDEQENEIKEKYEFENYNSNKLEIKLKGINNVTNMSFMFYEFSSLISLPDISKWNTNNVIDMFFMFRGCSSLSSLPDISKWNTNNVTNMFFMFSECHNLIISERTKRKFRL